MFVVTTEGRDGVCDCWKKLDEEYILLVYVRILLNRFEKNIPILYFRFKIRHLYACPQACLLQPPIPHPPSRVIS